MSLMEKGFWVTAGGLAGLVVGCMLFDDVELEPSRIGRRLEKGSCGAADDDEIESERIAATEHFDTSAADAHAQDIKEAMDKIGASLDEALESLKPKAVEPEEA